MVLTGAPVEGSAGAFPCAAGTQRCTALGGGAGGSSGVCVSLQGWVPRMRCPGRRGGALVLLVPPHRGLAALGRVCWICPGSALGAAGARGGCPISPPALRVAAWTVSPVLLLSASEGRIYAKEKII